MRRLANKLLIIPYISSLLLLTTSCAPTLMGRIKALQAAHNRSDVEKELSFFTDDVRCEFGEYVLEGKEQLRKAVEQNAIFNSHMTFSDCKQSGNSVTCKVKERNDLLKAAGIGLTYYEFSQQVFEKGLIKEVRAKPTEESVRDLREFQEGFGRWAADNQAQKWIELDAEGITKENVDKWLALVREWREEKECEK